MCCCTYYNNIGGATYIDSEVRMKFECCSTKDILGKLFNLPKFPFSYLEYGDYNTQLSDLSTESKLMRHGSKEHSLLMEHSTGNVLKNDSYFLLFSF